MGNCCSMSIEFELSEMKKFCIPLYNNVHIFNKAVLYTYKFERADFC